jgi:ribosomal protein S18 acetylase RimI-like enzyme
VTVAAVNDLYTRGTATLLASWEEYARGSAGAALARLDGVAVAVFPTEPERTVYNNALLDRGLGAPARAAAIAAMQATYEAAGVDRYAAWVHESDDAMHAELARRGFRLEETTRAMGMPLEDRSPAAHEADIGAASWSDYVAYLGRDGAPAGVLSGADPRAFHVLVARLGGEIVGTGMAFDHAGDCGVFNLGTLEPYRRRGLGTALVARLLRDAFARGNQTATLQSTQIAENVYAAAGFRNLGRILEYVPPRSTGPGRG